MGTNDRPIILGLVTDPDLPRRVADRLAEELPRRYTDAQITVEVVCDEVTAGLHSAGKILDATRERRRDGGWDYAICLTDLPVRHRDRPVLAHADVRGRVGVVSLPALGGMQPFRRAGQIVRQLLDELAAPEGEPAGGEARARHMHGLGSPLTHLLVPIRREAADNETDVGVRYSTTRVRGRLRLVSGMVRTNRPWRLVFGLSSAFAAAVATSVFGLTSSTVWQIGDQLGTGRHIVAAVVSVGLLVFWLVAAHSLWERPGPDGVPDREQAWLYNASTILTLLLGVGFLYAILFVVNLGVAAFLVPEAFLSSTLGHPVGWTAYLTLSWGFTTMGIVAGALGSSLESDEAVRQAAYGYREQQRRRAHSAEKS
ncbi:hypothetical protein CFN78_00160 [Amycolatopsis antarctica]|uniref:5,10-methylene-tetrahydrofolate dehydrogenase n=1 Tax=Amycolatopsis antarctica TaxID=1854586 RepID=A0A263D8J0_9PSEU|nr:hypothetical protein [Amycolatopsis antarctica]OZM74701.1 hypothetical protein CFN78_00160 [Amycolatopsis antarctica]